MTNTRTQTKRPLSWYVTAGREGPALAGPYETFEDAMDFIDEIETSDPDVDWLWIEPSDPSMRDKRPWSMP